ncbi:substrate-binding domain-containing protein [Magnetospirillum sp. SS-4]|uniref:substrate-binding domain-containing protein n=1 Tax=Magnetospirillum sp. SS-4 TaxID=2681465 RepID=UPI00138630F0|nr:substrate-binding domain-containing protein [Magnetospirillum sp. SS-4]CAA7616303.1 ABC-type tungstate transport system, permease component [Magnetospirillum sp. SS-4]
MLTRIMMLAAMLLLSPGAWAQERFITLASTTSTEQSGLFGHLLPLFKAETGIDVRVVAVGTGQALKLGERGDADALLVHDRAGEDKFVAEGFGIDRRDVMYNDFVVVGPAADPAGIKGRGVAEAFGRIAAAKAPFASRGDDSGTHRSELRIWKTAGVDVKAAGAGWYRELGSGMGPTLNTAAGMNAHALADRGTWASFKNRQALTILVEGDKTLFNPYGSILVNPARHAGVKAADAAAWHRWLTGPKGQAAIAGFKIGGEQLFFPDAR